jgi:hypothetical protein
MNEHATRTGRVAEPKPPAEPDGGRTHLPGAVDLFSLGANAEWGPQAARIMDVAETVDVASAAICQVFVEEMDAQRKIAAAEIAALDRRLALVELDNQALRAANDALKREVTLLGQCLDHDRALLARKAAPRSAAAKSKPKANGAKPPDGATLPGFVTK